MFMYNKINLNSTQIMSENPLSVYPNEHFSPQKAVSFWLSRGSRGKNVLQIWYVPRSLVPFPFFSTVPFVKGSSVPIFNSLSPTRNESREIGDF